MANRAVHHAWGVGTGLATGLIFAPKEDTGGLVAEVFGAGVGGAVGGRLADVLEPALSPNHRKIAHSGLAAAGLFRAAYAGWPARCRELAGVCRTRSADVGRTVEQRQNDRLEELSWRFLAGLVEGFLAGYASHLVLDASTPQGLPLLGLS
jgi:membrane-bound metal-dependent hydrolase YbcI (DUF457 family)